ncbi:hypothetical protein ACFOLA_04510 [Salinicoccus hispanicus]|uniref:Uncharacterized protein n=1 Tax=Salinicoccus hispanicus TaxID=157225 RepID=A0A6N8U1J4_9STAP|nr:hypothetical protein [Salinicoccus hispanicus]MXQ52078.1 hypothetical protein [Salinicoccus hispanicus]
MAKQTTKKDWIDSSIGLGMIFGCLIGIVIAIIFNPSIMVYTLPAGACIGLLIGTMIYAIYGSHNQHDK